MILYIAAIVIYLFCLVWGNKCGNNSQANLFEINVWQIDQIEIRNGNPQSDKVFTKRKDIEKIITLMNSFRFCCVEKATDAPGWSYMLVLKSCSLTSDSDEYPRIIGYAFTEDSIRFNDVWYKGDPGYFSELIALVDGS